jgi:hypothetical protein
MLIVLKGRWLLVFFRFLFLVLSKSRLTPFFNMDYLFHSVPVGSSGFQSIPLSSSGFQWVPVDSTQFHSTSVPFSSTRFHSVPPSSIQFHSVPFNSIQFHSIPLDSTPIPLPLNNVKSQQVNYFDHCNNDTTIHYIKKQG